MTWKPITEELKPRMHETTFRTFAGDLTIHETRTGRFNMTKTQPVYFTNPGLIDLDAIRTFGASSKEGENPIGYFGTGLKYAIGIILREGGTIHLHRGYEPPIHFTLKTLTIRGKPFQVIHMNGESMGFTSEVGKNWLPWMAYRELVSNAYDEGGMVALTPPSSPGSDSTIFVVNCPAILEAHRNHDSIFLPSLPLVAEELSVNIHQGPSESVYLNGVRIMELPKPTKFTYNFTGGITITEDRVAASEHSVHRDIMWAIIRGSNPDYIRGCITAQGDVFERACDLDLPSISPSETFIRVMDEIDFGHITNHSAITIYKAHSLSTKGPRASSTSRIEEMQLQKAIDFLKKLGHPVDMYPINITDDLKNDCLGLAHEGQIHISRRVFHQGTKQVAATILEEFIHLDTGLNDCCYSMQTYLFDLIISKGEEIIGEPL